MFLDEPSEVKVGFGVGDEFLIILSKDEMRSFRDIFLVGVIFWVDHFLERIDVNHY